MNLRIIFLFFSLFSFHLVAAQKASDYFVTQTKDTVFCSDIKYNCNTYGAMSYLSYTMTDGSPVVYKSKKTIPLILTMHIDGKNIDRIPLKPNSKWDVIYIERTVDGPLIVYLQHQNLTYSSSATVMYIFYIKMPNGQIYKINDKLNMQNIIIPYLKKCKAFTDQYQGDYSNKEEPFIEMIRLYNDLCPEAD